MVYVTYKNKKMQLNTFDYYDRLRQYQLHRHRIDNVQVDVPNHEAYSPIRPKLNQAKQYRKIEKFHRIQHQNAKIMKNLLNINNRKPHVYSQSSLSLPLIKKQYQIPLHEQENNFLAKKIINSKGSISNQQQLKRYRSHEKRLQSLSKYDQSNGIVKSRKQILAQIILLKKMKSSQAYSNQ